MEDSPERKGAMNDHSNKGVVVTGAGNGIGRGIAERFIKEGAHVVLLDINKAAVTSLADSLGPKAHAVVGDVRNESEIQVAIDMVVKHAGALDIMVNNAGIITIAPIVETDRDSWMRILDINVIGIALGSKLAATIDSPRQRWSSDKCFIRRGTTRSC